jgi:hypothetical protein
MQQEDFTASERKRLQRLPDFRMPNEVGTYGTGADQPFSFVITGEG